MLEDVALGIAGHTRPVNTAHVFAPAENLADEAFNRRQRRPALPVCLLGPRHHLLRLQHLHIEREGQ